MNRIEVIRQLVDDILRQQQDKEESRCGFVHLYGVSAICSLLALKRGLNSELCTIAGTLHDIWSYKTGNHIDHARLSSIEAKRIMKEVGYFSAEEITTICNAISNHSDKKSINDLYDEVLKDADVLQHYLYNTTFPVEEHEKERLNKVLKELDKQS